MKKINTALFLECCLSVVYIEINILLFLKNTKLNCPWIVKISAFRADFFKYAKLPEARNSTKFESIITFHNIFTLI